MSERKSGTERTKKCKKRDLVFFPPPWGANGTVVGLYRLDTTRILPELRQPGCRSLQNRQNTHNFAISQSELALPSTGSWLPSRLSSTLRLNYAEQSAYIAIFFQLELRKKSGTFKVKSGKAG